MPTYQYRCTECGHDLEAVQKFTDTALTECPSCGGQLRKVFNAVGVVFKGSGFYRTDSRSSNGDRDGKSESAGAGKESGSKESGSKESKTEAGSTTSPRESKIPAPAASSSSSSGSSTGSKAAGS